jgi:hypothetical protein
LSRLRDRCVGCQPSNVIAVRVSSYPKDERLMNIAIARRQSHWRWLRERLACAVIPDNSWPATAAPRSIKAGEGADTSVRKLIAFDDDTFDKLKQLGRDRMATFQELADEAFADLLKKHGIPIDLKDALRKSASLPESPKRNAGAAAPPRKKKSRS